MHSLPDTSPSHRVSNSGGRTKKLCVIVSLAVVGFFVCLQPSVNFDAAVQSQYVRNAPAGAAAVPEGFQKCVGDRLLADPVSRELGDNRGIEVIPLLVIPLMLDVYAFRELMCNISVPIRRLVLVQNMEEPVLVADLNRLEAQYGWSGRLVVRRHPENIGFAGAVNVGFRQALSVPRDEAPFVMIVNCDVGFPPGLLPRMLREVHENTQHDAARLDELAAEVAHEPSAYTPPNRPIRVLRSPHGDTTLSTSPLLPDRIRYAPLAERAKAFAGHYGFFTVNVGFAATIVPRLAISAVGFLDENFFPAYFEDIDYSWRLAMLGFKQHEATYGAAVHRVNLNLVIMRGSNTLSQSVPSRWYKRVYPIYAVYKYATQKWGTGPYGHNPSFKEPFDGRIPLDTWVLDTALADGLRRYGFSESQRYTRTRYDTSLLRNITYGN